MKRIILNRFVSEKRQRTSENSLNMDLQKDSFQRFGSDLTANILSYLDRSSQQKFLKLSKLWYKSMYEMAHFVTINYPQLPLLEVNSGISAASLQNTFNYVKRLENRRAHKLDIYAATHNLSFIRGSLQYSPFVEELKIRIWDNSLDDVYIFELLDIISDLKNLKKLYLNFGFNFSSKSVFNYFVEKFKNIICELVIENFDDFVDSDHFFKGLAEFKNLKTITVNNSSRDYQWLKKLSKAIPGLQKLFIVKAFNGDLFNISIHKLLKLWPNIRYIFCSDRDITDRYNLAVFKKYMRALYRQDPVEYPIYNVPNWANELIYSKEYKSLFLARHDCNNGKIPDNIENLFFINHPNRRDNEAGIIQITKLINKNPNIRSLRTNSNYLEALFPLFLGKAINNQNKSYLLGDLNSNWLYCGSNLKTNAQLMLDFFQFGPREENPAHFFH